MIGKEEEHNEEEPVLKVMDKRKFNVDGSLRDGVTIDKDPEPIEESATPLGDPEPLVEPIIDVASEAPAPEPEPVADAPGDDSVDEEDPASFINFLSTLVTNAAASLGAMPHPVTGQKTVDLDTGKYWIDVLAMLREKTKGNLAPKEDHLLGSILSDLQMQYVALTKATEEKLKAQAAQKFSSKDILGG